MVWLATHAGVYRYDGRQAVRRDGGVVRREVAQLLFDGEGRLWARDAYGGVWWAEPTREGGMAPLAPGGVPVTVDDLTLRDGAVWALDEGRLWRVRGDGTFSLEEGAAVPARTRIIRPDGDGWIAGTFDGFWRVDAGGAARKLLTSSVAVDAEVAPDGTVWTLDVLGALRALDRPTHGEPVLREWPFRGRGLRVRVHGDEVWAGYDNRLLRVRGDVTTEFGLAEGVESGGAVMFDREGSLWMTSFRGVGTLPDPGAALYTRTDGLLGTAQRALVRVGDTLWAAGWGGLGRLRADAALSPGSGLTVQPWETRVVKGGVCADATGLFWTVGSDGHDGPASLFAITPEGTVSHEVATPRASHFAEDCSSDGHGGVWIAGGDALYRVPAGGPAVRVAAWPTSLPVRAVHPVAADQAGGVWVGGGNIVCHYVPADADPWSCETLPGEAAVGDLAVAADDAVWATSSTEGVLRLDPAAHTWAPVPAVARLATHAMLGLSPARDGGIWVLGHATVMRVRDDGSTVDESLASWLGHLVSGAIAIEEMPDGALWIAHNGGLTHVPARSRQMAPPPGVTLLGLRVDGVAVEGASVRLPTPRSSVLLQFASPTFIHTALVRYRARIGDGAWTPTGGELELRDLGRGAHVVEVAASLDGETWGAAERVALEVPAPWWERWEVWAGVGALVVGIVIAVERARARVARRIEGLRTQVALDLHDQVGAGLGALGLLGGLLGHPLPEPTRVEAAARVARIANELGLALRAIVWSLRPESSRTGALARYLSEHARALLPGLDRAGGLTLSLSDVDVPLELDVLRAAQLTGLEALHNVARHAQASAVTVRFGPCPGDQWELCVEDDGIGIDPERVSASDAGNGLISLAARAHAVGGSFAIAPREGGGTRLRLVFPARRRGWLQIWKEGGR